MTIPDETLERLRKLLARATPLPWKVSDSHGLCVRAIGGTRAMVCDMSPDSSSSGWEGTRDDAELIVAAVNALPALLDDHARLRCELSDAREALKTLVELYEGRERMDRDDRMRNGNYAAGHEAGKREVEAESARLRAENDALADLLRVVLRRVAAKMSIPMDIGIGFDPFPDNIRAALDRIDARKDAARDALKLAKADGGDAKEKP